MIVNDEGKIKYYLSLGLTKKQIKEMLPSEIKEYCEEVIQKEFRESLKTKLIKPRRKK